MDGSKKMLTAKDALEIAKNPTKYDLTRALDLVMKAAVIGDTHSRMWVLNSTINSLENLGYIVDFTRNMDFKNGRAFDLVVVKWGPDPEPDITPREKERAERVKAYLTECEMNGVKPHECSICDRICCDREH